MKKALRTRLLIFGSILSPFILSAEELQDWPEPLESKIEEILKIKEEAMNLPFLRSDDGVLGKRAEALMSEIGEMIKDPELIQKLKKRQGDDIMAKISLWAIDRRSRPDEYKRFAEYYVNEPVGREEVVKYFSRTINGTNFEPDPFAEPVDRENVIPRPGTWRPNPVDEEDQKDVFRLILEYSFYMPPSGRGFDNDESRGHLAAALLAIGNCEKSMVVMASDAQIAVKAEVQFGNENVKLYNSYASLGFLTRIATKESFAALSRIGTNGLAGKRIESSFKRTWSDPALGSEHPTSWKLFEAWQDIATKDWVTPEDGSFAAWLKKHLNEVTTGIRPE